MSQDRSSFLSRAVITLLAATFFFLPLTACNKKPPEKSPAEVEELRQEHRNAAQRELGDG